MGEFHIKKLLLDSVGDLRTRANKERGFRIFLRQARALNVIGKSHLPRWKNYSQKQGIPLAFHKVLWEHKGKKDNFRGAYEPVKYGFSSLKEFLMPDNWKITFRRKR